VTKPSNETERENAGDSAIALLAGPLDGFVAARDALSKALAGRGEAERAKAVKAMRRPTLSAWAVNRLAREARDELEALFEAADRVRSGRGDALREAMRDRTAAHGRALAKAKSILEEAGHAAQPETLRRIGGTLHAAEVGASARARVEAGLVTEDLDASSLEDDEAPTPRTKAKGDGEAKETRAQKEAREHERRERQKREAEAKRIEHDLDVARRSVEAAERRLAHARAQIESAQRAHEAAQAEVDDARRRRDDTERAWRAAIAAAND
jgi:hypothetical protein